MMCYYHLGMSTYVGHAFHTVLFSVVQFCAIQLQPSYGFNPIVSTFFRKIGGGKHFVRLDIEVILKLFYKIH